MKQRIDALLLYSRVDGRGGEFARVDLRSQLGHVRAQNSRSGFAPALAT